jgi:hypothetical protein
MQKAAGPPFPGLFFPAPLQPLPSSGSLVLDLHFRSDYSRHHLRTLDARLRSGLKSGVS